MNGRETDRRVESIRHRLRNALRARGEDVTLVRTARATFERRATPITAGTPAALAGPLYSSESRAQQWRAYVTRNQLDGVPPDFELVGDVVIGFLRPVWEDLGSGRAPAGDWPPGGPWR